MAKQKVVLKLSMEDAKKRAKALQCAVGLHGVMSASYEGDKITVVGEGIDSVELTRLLRKKMGHVELQMVMAIEEKKEEKKEEKVKAETDSKSNTQPLIFPYHYNFHPTSAMIEPPYHYAYNREPNYDESICTIM